MRTFLVLEGQAHICRRDKWYGADNMSASNRQIVRDLGEPTVQDVSTLCDRRLGPLEVGYHMCFIGDVLDSYREEISNDLPGFVSTLRTRDVNESPWRSPALHLKNIFPSRKRAQGRPAAQ